MNILKTIILDIENFGRYFWHILQTVFANVKTELIADATEIFHAEALALQNSKPGLDAKTFIAELIAVATPLLIKDLAVLPYTVISAIASVVAHDVGVKDQAGNAGNLGGGQTAPA